MNQTTPLRQGLYFEEFKVGLSILSAARTVTESDIVSFAGLSGDVLLLTAHRFTAYCLL